MKSFVLAVLASGLWLAAPAAAEEPMSPPPLVEAPPPLLEAPEPEVSEVPAVAAERPEAVGPGLRVARIGVGALAATVLGLAIGVGAGYGSYVLMCGAGGCSGWNNVLPSVFALLLGGVGVVLGVPLGALVAGKLMGSKGSFGWAILGALAGGVAAYATYYLIDLAAGAGSVATLAYALPVLLVPLGAAAGLEFSSSRNEPEIRVSPTLALGPQGGFVGAAARF